MRAQSLAVAAWHAASSGLGVRQALRAGLGVGLLRPSTGTICVRAGRRRAALRDGRPLQAAWRAWHVQAPALRT